jgi:hypothetical protein
LVPAGDRGREIARKMGNPEVLSWSMPIRTHIIDEMI